MRPDSASHLGVPRGLWSLALTLSAASAACAQFGLPSNPLTTEQPHATMRLATEHQALTPGDQELAVIFTIDDHWHLYWHNPGDTGLAPEIKFNLPAGIEQTGDLSWPTPQRYIHSAGQSLDYIYEHELALILPINVDSALLGTQIEISATGSWLVCKEACIPGDGNASFRTSVQQEAGEFSPDAAAINQSKQRIPEPITDTENFQASWDNLTLNISIPGADHITAYPIEPRLGGVIDPINEAISKGDSLALRFDPRAQRANRVTMIIEYSARGSRHFRTLELQAPRQSN